MELDLILTYFLKLTQMPAREIPMSRSAELTLPHEVPSQQHKCQAHHEPHRLYGGVQLVSG